MLIAVGFASFASVVVAVVCGLLVLRGLRQVADAQRALASAQATAAAVQGAQGERDQRFLSATAERFAAMERAHERTERGLREELARGREEAQLAMRGVRDDVRNALADVSRAMAERLSTLTASNEAKLEGVRGIIDERLQSMQVENGAKLEQMRATVDEKLQGTLEKRLGESFKLVSDRLELVHKGLGEMQSLATGVGDLRKVLTNVKTRGIWGEVQLGNLLEQIMTPEQYASNVATIPNSRERVEFAIRMPGHDSATWLPIDAKFPQEDYQRLIEASERGDVAGVDAAGKALEAAAKKCAADIRTKYVQSPHTVDFGIMFVPIEGLYAELVRRPGLADNLREQRIHLCGPTTLAALLNSLQMGFRTLALQKRSSEVWQVLGAVKAEFGKFSEVLAKVQKKLNEASSTIEDAAQRTRVMEKKLKGVDQLPSAEEPVATLPEGDPARLAEVVRAKVQTADGAKTRAALDRVGANQTLF